MDDIDKVLNNKPAIRRATSNTIHSSASVTNNAEVIAVAAAVAASASTATGPDNEPATRV